MANIVYIAASLDGYIADKNGSVDWLHTIPNPEQSDFGFADFLAQMDALVMGRNTFETVCSLEGPWPYSIPVFVLSSSTTSVPEQYSNHAELISGSPREVVKQLNNQGYKNLYIDGGNTVQGFLAEGLVDEMIISRLPVVLGGGVPLFADLDQAQWFEHKKTQVLLGEMVQSHYQKKDSQGL